MRRMAEPLGTGDVAGRKGRDSSYRPDVDGLRGLAIILVVAFHVSPLRFPGGFVGVDVFFVISGFLITRLIVEDIDGPGFRIGEFWWRRARRLFPALAIALAMVLAIGMAVLDDFALSRLGLYVVSAATFSTNLVALSEVGYFETGAVRPLLHLWSLAVEEQFYLLWPLVLLAIGRRAVLRVVVVVAAVVASLGLSTWMTSRDPELAFFLPFTRFWELLLGAAVFLTAGRVTSVLRRRRVLAGFLQLAGLLGIAWAFVSMSEQTPFPGTAAIVPTTGAALVILGNSASGGLGSALSVGWLRGIGLISYPLYLFHYPLIAFMKQGDSASGRLVSAVLAVGIALVLAVVTYRFVEQPIRAGRSIWRPVIRQADRRPRRTVTALAMVLAILAAAGAWSWRGIYRLPEGDVISDLSWVANGFGRDDLYDTRCFVTKPWQDAGYFERGDCIDAGEPGQRRVLLVGDSHAGSLAPGIRTLITASRLNVAFSQITAGWCGPFYGDQYGSSPECRSINGLAEDFTADHRPEVVILHASWIGQLDAVTGAGLDRRDEFEQLVSRYLDLGAGEVWVVGPVPRFIGSLPQLLLDEAAKGSNAIPPRTKRLVDPQTMVVSGQMREWTLEIGARVRFLSAADAFCNRNGCLTQVGGDVRTDLVAWDNSHITINAARYVAPLLFLDLL